MLFPLLVTRHGVRWGGTEDVHGLRNPCLAASVSRMAGDYRWWSSEIYEAGAGMRRFILPEKLASSGRVFLPGLLGIYGHITWWWRKVNSITIPVVVEAMRRLNWPEQVTVRLAIWFFYLPPLSARGNNSRWLSHSQYEVRIMLTGGTVTSVRNSDKW